MTTDKKTNHCDIITPQASPLEKIDIILNLTENVLWWKLAKVEADFYIGFENELDKLNNEHAN